MDRKSSLLDNTNSNLQQAVYYTSQSRLKQFESNEKIKASGDVRLYDLQLSHQNKHE